MKNRYYVGTLLVMFLAMGALVGVNCPGGITLPSEFTNADLRRGGLLYDKWWTVNGAAEPTGDHARYPAAGQKSGADTHRCKECHGWDYKGASGAYATGSHSTGIMGIFGTTLSAQEVFDEIKAHNFGASLSDDDIWDLTRFVLDDNGGQFDTDTIIHSADKEFHGTADPDGQTLYEGGIAGNTPCATCHGTDGKTLNFGDAANPEYVGTLADDNPWEFQHKVRFGHPGTAMPSSVEAGGTAQNVADVGAYAQTLPTS